jgi:hypothetical protein
MKLLGNWFSTVGLPQYFHPLLLERTVCCLKSRSIVRFDLWTLVQRSRNCFFRSDSFFLKLIYFVPCCKCHTFNSSFDITKRKASQWMMLHPSERIFVTNDEREKKRQTDRQINKRDKKWDRRKNYAVSYKEKDRERERKKDASRLSSREKGKEAKASFHFNISDSSYMLSSLSLWKKCA